VRIPERCLHVERQGIEPLPRVHGAATDKFMQQTGALQNTHQTNCPTVAACGKFGCSCPPDNFGDGGVLINEFAGYQCAYQGGACTWDFVSASEFRRVQDC
jgi:hypothetical protein